MHAELTLRTARLPSGATLSKEKLTTKLVRKAKKWGVQPNFHSQADLLKSLALDLCSLYENLYQQSVAQWAGGVGLQRMAAFKFLDKPFDPKTMNLTDPHHAKKWVEKHLVMLVALYEVVIQKDPDSISFLSLAMYEASMAMAAMYFRDLNPFFAYEAYEVYEPGSALFTKNYTLADHDIKYALREIYKMALVSYQHQPAPIIIPYRDNSWGEGALYDHRAIQKITGRPTVVSLPANTQMDALETKAKLSKMRLTDDPKKISGGDFYMPQLATEEELHSGLLVVPGRPPVGSRVYAQTLRNEHERPLIRRAFNARQPYLGVCGGMWQTLAALRNVDSNINDGAAAGLYDTDSHRGAMKLLDEFGGVPSSDLKHGLNVDPNSLLATMMQLTLAPKPLKCNSVHWQSVHPKALPSVVKIAAYSTPFRQHAPRAGDPAPGVVEAFAARSGAPQVAVQWHPEAFADDTREEALPHNMLIYNLSREADIFSNRYQMQRELKMQIQGPIYTINSAASARIDDVLSGYRAGNSL
jgi:gamma-glutamyl-gamma-aminobutyrate hydrolase PuuD